MLCSFYKASMTFGSSIGDITFKMNKKMLLLYPELLSPLLKYDIQFWRPEMNNNTDDLKSIHRRVSRMVMPFEAIDEERFFRKLGMFVEKRDFVCVCEVLGEDA